MLTITLTQTRWLDEANVQFRITGHAVPATAASEDAPLPVS